MSQILLSVLSLYKRMLSPLLGNRCRFHPSCSDYARIAVSRFGTVRGGSLALWRIARCHPFSAGGIDEVPQTFTLRRGRDCRCGDRKP